jgi:hypothetical protein
LDFALGGIAQAGFAAIAGPSCTGKTLLLLEIATRINRRYQQNVVFCTAQAPAMDLAQRVKRFGKAPIVFGSENDSRGFSTENAGRHPAIYFYEVMDRDPSGVLKLAEELRRSNPSACAVILFDGFSSYQQPPLMTMEIDGRPCLPAERWRHRRLEPGVVRELRRWSSTSTVPVIVGFSTPSLLDSEAPTDLECMFRSVTDRWLVLHRPALYCATDQIGREDPHVVCLKGTSPQWWDERCARLRWWPERHGFETLA